VSEQFERITEISGAYDKRDPDPKKNYGIHGMEIRFVLKGEKGATQFLVYTGMHLPNVQDWLFARSEGYNQFSPTGADIGYHSKTPHYEGQTVIDQCCPYLGCPCYYDGSGLQADEFMPRFLEGGDKVVWPMLEERYRLWFGEQP
jgi:hypothetical protein